MRRHSTQSVPLTATVLLSCASRLVPSRERWEWNQEWQSELWYVHRECKEQHDSAFRIWYTSVSFSLGAVSDALWLRRNSGRRTNLLESAQGCALALFGAAAAALAVACLLPASRAAITFHNFAESDGLVFVSRAGLTTASSPTIDFAEYQHWKSHGRTWFREISFYRPIREEIKADSGETVSVPIGVTSDNITTLLKTPVSAEDVARARSEHRPTVVLSPSAAERLFRGGVDPIGRFVNIAGLDALIVGIRPGYASVVHQRQEALLLVDDSQLSNIAPGQPGFVVAAESQVAKELGAGGSWSFSTLEDGEYVGFECAPITKRVQRPMYTFLFALFLACLALPATTPLPMGEYPAANHPLFSEIRWRRWVFLCMKIGLSLAVIYFTSLIVAFGNSRIEPESSQCIQLTASFAGLLLSFRWALRDQRLRCPVCLNMLTNPARVGHPSRSFLAWHGTELMCDKGHGLLHVPEMSTSWFSTQRWLSLDPSWRGLFPTLVER
jgi:hypothetical protein